MAKKPEPAEQPDEHEILVRRVDEMMDARGPAPTAAGQANPSPDKDSVADVAASVNQQLSENLATPAEKKEVVTAPVLPGDTVKPDTGEAPAIAPASTPTEPTAPQDTPALESDKLDDKATDKAVDEIAASESDLVLAVEDSRAAKASGTAASPPKAKHGSLFKRKRFWLVLALFLVVLFALPATRYKILGLVVKRPVTVTVLDSKTMAPVSNAEVKLDGAAAKTDADGHAKVSAGMGKRQLVVEKRYYKDYHGSYFVGFKASSPKINLVASGRLVPVTVVNSIDGKPVADAQIQSKGTSAKTDKDGHASIALPADSATSKGQVSLAGYNTAAVNIQVTNKTLPTNTFKLVPAGKVYFLSNQSGTLDVVKTNLDGSGRKTVLTGTGKEDPRTTSLLAARDWRYLVLKAHREGAQEALYLIDTSNDKVTLFDNSDADITLVGWYNHDFIYSLTRHYLHQWQSGRQVIKAYDADHQQLNQLDQDQAEGSSTNYAYQSFFNFYILNGVIIYNTQWNGFNSSSNYNYGSKTDSIRGVGADGLNKKDYKTFAAAKTNFFQAALYEPQVVYYAVYDNSGKPAFYSYENQAVKAAAIDQGAFEKDYPTFLLSPSGSRTFWSEVRDGKNTLFIGDSNAGSKQQLASSSDFAPYGWYSNDYVLVAKNSSELYVATAASLKASRAPLKISDYYKPAQTYQGYGYGYGGL